MTHHQMINNVKTHRKSLHQLERKLPGSESTKKTKICLLNIT